MTIKILVVGTEGIILKTEADEIILPGLDGQIGILKNHAPLISVLEIGVLKLKLRESKDALIVLGGFVEIEDNLVIVVVNGIEEIKKIDLAAAQVALALATQELEQAKSDKEKIQSSQNLKRVMARAQAMAFLS
jgi:F-type H+-transporting ATPase subunit epsilon